MARRGARSSVPPSPRPSQKPDAKRAPRTLGPTDDATSRISAGRLPDLGERLRRVALGLTAALVTARAYLAERARPEGRGRRGAVLGPRRPDRRRAGARRRARRRPVPVPLVVDRRRGRRPDGPGRHQRVARARSAAGDQPGLGVGRAGVRLPPGAQPAADPGRVVGPGRGAGRDGGRRLGLWALSGRRRAAAASGSEYRAEPASGSWHASWASRRARRRGS